MNRVCFASRITVVWIAAVALSATSGSRAAAQQPQAPVRTVEFSYQVHFPAQLGATSPAYLWIPAPAARDGHQTIVPTGARPAAGDISISSDAPHTVGKDAEYHNQFFEFHPSPAQVAAGFDATVRFTVTRQEYVVLHNGAVVPALVRAAAEPEELSRYLQSDKLVPINGLIAQLAQQQTAGATTPLEKARQIYDYVVSTMHYDKSGEGWGRGDAIWACDSKRGNCTDFHSLFIGMMRSVGIPARFEIGFPLPEGQSEGTIPGYHCWSEFYIEGIGWIPVDASEASKHPAKKDYFFGALDDNRVLFTYGRDLRLSPEQQGPPLNYFIYPYAEIGGKPVKDLQTHFPFRDVAPAPPGDQARANAK